MSEPDPFKINEAVIDLWRCYTIERDMAKELEAENARLKAEVERLTAFTTRTIIPNEELQKQVERLTKAGDAVCESPYLWETDPTVIEWRAAKEGKQP
jgi:hypothetical protein